MSVKKYFVSRYKDGVLLEADYSQLEIRVLAALSGDETLRSDLDSGADLHLIRAAEWLNKDPSRVTEHERRLAKTISFQLQYGASANGIADKNNITKAEAHAFIDAYYRRYPSVKAWQDSNIKEVEKTRTPSNRRTIGGIPAGRGVLSCPVTKRKYVFFEKDGFRGGTNFYAPEIKNYPVQGLATGDIVPMVLGRLMRNLLTIEHTCSLINTVHDSILVDTTEKDWWFVANVLKNTMEDAPRYIKEDYGYNWTTRLPVDVKRGKNWEDMEKVDFSLPK